MHVPGRSRAGGSALLQYMLVQWVFPSLRHCGAYIARAEESYLLGLEYKEIEPTMPCSLGSLSGHAIACCTDSKGVALDLPSRP